MEPIQLDPERGNLNKWEMYKLLVHLNEPLMQVPNTAPMSPQSVMTFLSRHQQIYLKPVGTWGGNGISRVTRITPQQELPCQYQWESPLHEAKIFAHRADLLRHLLALYKGQSCIVQAAAPILDWEARPFDVRLLMQKEFDDRRRSSAHQGPVYTAQSGRSIRPISTPSPEPGVLRSHHLQRLGCLSKFPGSGY